MSTGRRIAVIGAGIGGLTVAAVLLRRGFSVAVYEQAKAFARVGAGIQMSANAMKVLRGLGLESQVSQSAFSPTSWKDRDGIPVRCVSSFRWARLRQSAMGHRIS